MGLPLLAIAGLQAFGVGMQVQGRRDAKKAQAADQAAQRASQSEQRAANAAESARERRMQLREERVRKARVMQAAVNTGTEDSSGELGALGALSTQLATNIGTNLGRIQTADNLSIFSQQRADAQGQLFNAQRKQQTGQFIFDTAGKFAPGS